MTNVSNTGGGRLRRAAYFGKWGAATAMVLTEAVQNYLPNEPEAGLIDHLHTGAYWSLGLQLAGMGSAKVWQKLELGGSITFTWGKKGQDPTEAGSEPSASQSPGASPEVRTVASAPASGAHDAR